MEASMMPSVRAFRAGDRVRHRVVQLLATAALVLAGAAGLVAGTPGVAAGAVTVSSIVAGTAVPTSGATNWNAVACTSATSCIAVGTGNGSTTNQGVVEPFNGTTYGTVQTVASTVQLEGVACPTSTDCIAVGYSYNGSTVNGAVVPIVNGTAGATQVLSGTYSALYGISCPSATLCVASGVVNSYAGVVPLTVSTSTSSMTITAGTPVGNTGQINFRAISCPSTTVCDAAGGTNSSTAVGTFVPMTVSGGSSPAVTFGTLQNVSGTSALFGIACPTTTECLVTGTSGQLAVVTNGTPGALQTVAGNGYGDTIACFSTSMCVAGNGSTVQLIVNGTPSGSASLSGFGSVNGIACVAGTNSCTAVGSIAGGGQAVAASLTVVTDTATSVTSSGSPSTYGQPVTFTATVSPTDGGGTVAFDAGGNAIVGCGSLSLNSSGGTDTATCMTTSLPVGTLAITATYSGDTSYGTSTGTLVGGQVVNQATTTTSVSTSGSPSTYGRSVTLMATVSPADGGGTVAFAVGGTTITGCGSQTLTLGPPNAVGPSSAAASCTTSSLPAGTDTITATYTGDTDYSGSSGTLAGGQVVNQVPTSTSVAAIPNPSTYGQSVTMTATVSGSDGGGTVAFDAGGTTIAGCGAKALAGSGGTDTATCTTSSLPLGTATITATYSGDTDYGGSSATLAGGQVVKQAPTSTSVTSSADPSTYGEAVTYTATVSPTDGGGTVAFDAGGTTLTGCGAKALAGSGGTDTATCTTSSLPLGAATITATYTGDTDYLGSSATLAGGQVVRQAPTSTSVTSSADPSTLHDPVTFTATVSGSDGGGTVAFTAGGMTLTGCGAVVLTPSGGTGTATCTTSSLPLGSATITATYSGDTDYLGSSATLAGGQVVQQITTSTSVTSSADPSTLHDPVTFTATVSGSDAGGTVAFTAGGTTLTGCGAKALSGSGGTDTATCTTSSLSLGTSVITATYSGDTDYGGSSATLAGGQVVQFATGYWTVTADGAVTAFGVPSYGSAASFHLNNPIVGMASTPDGKGYWLVASDGGVFAFGDAHFYGSTGALCLNKPMVGVTSTPDGKGYWLVASDGGVFAFGDAHFYGSTGAMTLNKPVVGMAVAPGGRGYWLVASDGGIFSFGDAVFHGSTGSMTLNKPVVGMAADPVTGGYWLVASDGGVFSFDAAFHGSAGGRQLNEPIVGMAATPDGLGYHFVASDGGIFSFGDAVFHGSATGSTSPIVGMAAQV